MGVGRLQASAGLILGVVVIVASPAATGNERTKIARLLAAHCLECHNDTRREGGLDLSRRASAFRGGEQGAAITAGNPSRSLLWKRVKAGEMPPESQLNQTELQTVRKWIRDGATWPAPKIDRFQYTTARRAGFDWWSLQPLRRPRTPRVSGQWGINSIDRFILARLEAQQLKPSPRAQPRTLVRRLYFDVLGLPPPFAIVQKFEKDPSPAAWEKLVDGVLKSKHYGERWAQHWLDVARFGETHGYEYNVPRENAWHYRDWVIRSLNADLPYREFVRMQIAGDLLQPGTVDGAAAVGFLVAGVHNTVLGRSEAMRRASRHEELEEIAGTTAQAFLGLTINCARCHDHKFDPISNQEYYQFIAALDGVTHGTRKVSENFDARQAGRWERRRDELDARLLQLAEKRGVEISKSANAIQTTSTVDAKRFRRSVHTDVACFANRLGNSFAGHNCQRSSPNQNTTG